MTDDDTTKPGARGRTAIDERADAAAELRNRETDRPVEITDLVAGLLGKETPASRAAVERYFQPDAAKGAELRGPVAFPTEAEAESLAFCFRIALEHDHGGAKRLRRLLLAWHNAAELGGFDFSDLWSLDDTYRAHALTVIGMIARSPQGWYAEHYGYAADMAAIVDMYGPRS
jgi:hypothetical protein